MCGARDGGRGRKAGTSRGNGSDADAGDQGERKKEGSAVDCGDRVRGSREVRPRLRQKTVEAMLVLEIKMDVTKKDHPSFAVTEVKLQVREQVQ